jgi:hypothetical protein
MTTTEAGTDRSGFTASLDAYAVAFQGLVALLPASGRMLSEGYTRWASDVVRALATRMGARGL